MSLQTRLEGWVDRVAAEFNAIRTALSGKANASHQHAAGDVSSGTFGIGRIPTGTSSSTVALGNRGLPSGGAAGRFLEKGSATDFDVTWAPLAGVDMPLVLSAIRSGSVAAALTSDASTGGNLINLTVTGNATFGLSTPTDHQVITVHFLASGGARTVTFSDTSIVPAGGRAMSYAVPQNEVLIAEFRYIGTRAAGTPKWALTRAEVTGASAAAVQSETASATAVSASYAVAATGAFPSAVFVAPPSGIVRLDYSGALVHGTAGQTVAWTPEVRTGNTIGGGTQFWAPSDSYRGSVKGQNDVESGRGSLIAGLTPGVTYHARMLGMATAATGYFARMRLAVTPIGLA